MDNEVDFLTGRFVSPDQVRQNENTHSAASFIHSSKKAPFMQSKTSYLFK